MLQIQIHKTSAISQFLRDFSVTFLVLTLSQEISPLHYGAVARLRAMHAKHRSAYFVRIAEACIGQSRGGVFPTALLRSQDNFAGRNGACQLQEGIRATGLKVTWRHVACRVNFALLIPSSPVLRALRRHRTIAPITVRGWCEPVSVSGL